jgi:hypothetical protein
MSNHLPDSSAVRFRLEPRTVLIICWLLALALGGLRAWATRYQIDPDTISYLDMADAYLRGDWPMALNGLWNPFYAWLLCLVQLVAKPHPYWEFPAVHVLNFGIYIAGLACLHFFLLQLAHYNKHLSSQPAWQGTAIVPRWALFAFGYLLYMWTSLDLIGFDQGADLCLANFVYLAFGLLFWIGTEPTHWKPFALLGLVLGCGYLTKAVMLPLMFVFIAISLYVGADLRKALLRGMLAFLVFVAVASPFIAALSHSKGRLTFSDTGKDNYAVYVCMDSNESWSPPYFHWQGDIPNCGTPTHPTRKIYDSPAVYEFGTPFRATYGAWYDPSYWYEGVVPHFSVRNQIHVLRFHAEEYFNLFFCKQPALLVGLVILGWMSWRGRYDANGIATQWRLLVPAVAALALYGMVYVEWRYIGAYVTILWLGLYMGVRLPDSHASRSLLAGVMGSVVLATASSTLLPESLNDVRAMVHRQQGANDVHVRVAKGLKELGMQPGDKVASIGDTFLASLWARVARVHIVAEVTKKDAPDYWHAETATKAQVRAVLASTGARAIVTDSPPKEGLKEDAEAHWHQIGDPSDKDARFYARFYVCFLDETGQ